MHGALLLLLLIPDSVPVGAYSMPDLCAALTKATGTHHYASVALQSYPVFVSVKSGDPARVRLLVASALGGEWKEADTGYTLVAKKPAPDEDFADFSRLFILADSAHGYAHGATLKDLYNLAPGRFLRFGDPAGAYVLPWSEEIKGVASEQQVGGKRLAVRRMAPGIFEFAGMKEIQFSGLPKNVVDLLGDDAKKKVITPELQAKIHAFGSDAEKTKAIFGDPVKKDPIVARAELILPLVADAVSVDLVVTLSDMTIFALPMGGEGDGTLRGCLQPYAIALDWDVVDGAVVGRLPVCERLVSTQADRKVLAKFISSIGAKGVCDVNVLSAYVAAQNPAASDCWMDAMLLAMTGVVMDQEYIGDYPFNVRLYLNLTQHDWAALRSGEPLNAVGLSMGAQRALLDVLLQSRSRIGGGPDGPEGGDDPAWWPSLKARDVVVKATITEEDVLVVWARPTAEVFSLSNAVANYDRQAGDTKKEPFYQPAHRRKLKMTISSADGEHHVETGFSLVQLDESHKPGPWQKLPADMAKAFENRPKPGDAPPDIKP